VSEAETILSLCHEYLLYNPLHIPTPVEHFISMLNRLIIQVSIVRKSVASLMENSTSAESVNTLLSVVYRKSIQSSSVKKNV
jgi:hypothetical protein